MRAWTISIAVLIALLAGCIVAPVAPPPPPRQDPEATKELPPTPPKGVSDTDRLLSYYTYAQSLPREQFTKELENTRRFYDTTGSSLSRMQLVLLHAAAPPEHREPGKIFDLLQAQLSAKDDGQAELAALASLLKTLLSDNRLLESNLDSHKEKLKEETKKSEALKQKLDALIEAERKLLERSRPR